MKALLDAGADVNQTSEFGWTRAARRHAEPLLSARRVPARARRGSEHRRTRAAGIRSTSRRTTGTSKAATIRRASRTWIISSTSSGCWPRGANPNLRMRSSTETRTVFTHQWLFEEGATPFLRAAQSGDIVLMKLLLEHGADPVDLRPITR